MRASNEVLKGLLAVGTVCLLIAIAGFGIAFAGYLELGRAIGVIGIGLRVSCVVVYGFLKLFGNS